MIDQITVFLENKKGRLASLCRCLGNAGINMAALSVADTTDYGVVRIICGDTHAALSALESGGYRAIITKVVAIAVPHRPGAAADLLEKLDDLDLNIEYGYCFSTADETAIMALKIADPAGAAEARWAIEAAGFKVYDQSDLE
ncbi:amino acid-binding protein [Olsenella sp. An290]|uniref:amino acid-binding protein n=1 Tax=Olsenella sp. An290 TaxID=1965625 RepID=UPI000B3938EC|nr:amino acid-binding protein [Olsenella sp. An290]OUO34683.1 amino acid-binding protein [Olsenella sp. An290]